MSTLICFALKEEAAPFRKIAAGKGGHDPSRHFHPPHRHWLPERQPARGLQAASASERTRMNDYPWTLNGEAA